jgi:hypothetical protein
MSIKQKSSEKRNFFKNLPVFCIKSLLRWGINTCAKRVCWRRRDREKAQIIPSVQTTAETSLCKGRRHFHKKMTEGLPKREFFYKSESVEKSHRRILFFVLTKTVVYFLGNMMYMIVCIYANSTISKNIIYKKSSF